MIPSFPFLQRLYLERCFLNYLSKHKKTKHHMITLFMLDLMAVCNHIAINN